MAIYLVFSSNNDSSNSFLNRQRNIGSNYVAFEQPWLGDIRQYNRTIYSRKGFYSARICYYRNSSASFQQAHLLVSGDVSTNPGPDKCQVCDRAVAKNHRVVRCIECDSQTHIKCGEVSPKEYNQRKYVNNWLCTKCLLSHLPGTEFLDFSFSDSDHINSDTSNNSSCAFDEPDLLQQRKTQLQDILISYLNINSVQNKFEEFKILNNDIQCQAIILSETKIYSSYKDDLFNLQGYQLYRKDRKKGGGGLMAFISSAIASKKVKPPILKCIEVISIEMKINNNDILLVGTYRPPKATGKDYYLKLENELHSLCMWAELQKQTWILLGDLNLNRLDVNSREGKILKDLEDSFNFKCLITSPTRVTDKSCTLIDVLLTNRPFIFNKAGTYNPEISDHHLIYGLMNDKIIHYRPKTIDCRSLKNVDIDLLCDDLAKCPWHVGDTRDLKQPGRVCGRRREKTSEVWVENVVQSGKNKCLSKLPSRLVAEVGRLH